jgi:hypothetical protein
MHIGEMLGNGMYPLAIKQGPPPPPDAGEWPQIAIALIFVGVGVLLIVAGLRNMRTKTAVDMGRGSVIRGFFGMSNTYSGRTAVTIGVLRIVCGAAAILFGVFLAIYGPILAKK